MRKLLIILTVLISTLVTAQSHYPIKNFLRTNCYGWNLVGDWSWPQSVTDRKIDALASLKLSGIRVSTDSYANKDSFNNIYLFNPERRGFKTDTGIVLLRKKLPGLFVDLCYQNQPYNIQAEYKAAGVKSTVYKHLNDDASLSQSYSELAHDCYVLASRGGRNTNVPDYPLFKSPFWWEPSQIMYKGAAFYDAIEALNESDNQYSNTNPLNGAQLAAMWAAAYDSIKKADPTMLVSTTGIANGDPQIMLDALKWFNANRGGKLAFDIWQQHHYPWAWYMGLSGGLPGELSIIPEIDKVKAACPTGLYSVGEWSWDVHPDSPINAPAHDGYSAEQTRGQAAIRTIFKYSQHGVHDAYWYRTYPDYVKNIDSSGEVFATSALIKQTDDSCHWVRTTVGDYFAQASAFGDYTFSSALRDDSVQVLKFVNPNHPDLYALWTVERITPYTDLRGVSHPAWHERKYDYTLSVSGLRYDLNDDSSGVLLQQPFYGGTVQLSSKPVFVTTTTILPVRDPEPLPPINGKRYHVKVYRLMDGAKVLDKTNADLEQVIKTLPKLTPYVIQYFDNKNFYSKKIIKQ
jgi:hypothetical protein